MECDLNKNKNKGQGQGGRGGNLSGYVCVCVREIEKIEIGRRHTKERQIVYKIARIKNRLNFSRLTFWCGFTCRHY